jgi:hemoglobin
MTYKHRILLMTVFVAGTFMATAAQTARLEAQAATAAAAPTLYSRLGGYDFITRFVDTAFPRVATDAQLSRLFRGHARDSQMRQRQLIVDALCRAAGGPCLYIGRDLRVVHEGLHITDDDWRTFMGIIQTTVREFRLADETQRDFLKLFEDFRPLVVIK